MAAIARLTAAVSSFSRQSRIAFDARSITTWANCPTSSSKTRSVLQIDRGDSQRRRETNLEFAEGGAADRAAETRNARLADAGALGEVANRHTRGRLVVGRHRGGHSALCRREVSSIRWIRDTRSIGAIRRASDAVAADLSRWRNPCRPVWTRAHPSLPMAAPANAASRTFCN